MWMLNMTTIYDLGIYLFKTLSMQKENKKPPEYNSLSSIFDGVVSNAQIYAFLCVKREKTLPILLYK